MTDWILQHHTMIRVKDPKVSEEFYTKVMGMRKQREIVNEAAKFNLYFFSYGAPASDPPEGGANMGTEREGFLELTWNYGTEKDDKFQYHNGNDEPQGFGHIAVTVDDIDEACKRFEEHGVKWKKRLTDGRMKNIAFVLGMSTPALIQTPSFPTRGESTLTTYESQIRTITGLRLCRTRS